MELISNKKSTIKDENNFYKLDKFKYLIEKKELKGTNVLINTNYQFPEGDKLYFSDAVINLETFNFIGKDTEVVLHKNVFENDTNDPRLIGVSSSKKGDLTTVNKGIFTSCNKDQKCPPWAIQAKEIIHDKKKKQIIYKDANLRIFDFPVLYFPKFFHPDPTVVRQSGFLKPKFSSSKIFGDTFNLPYFHVISENQDLTVSPTISDKETFLLQSEYRQENKNSSLIVDLGLVDKFESKFSNKKKNIIHLFAKSEIDLNLEDFNHSKIDLYVEKTNNDTYLKIFDSYLLNNSVNPKNKDVLSSGLDLKLINEKFNIETGFSSFEDLNKPQSDRYQYILPYYRFNSFLNNNFGTINFNSNGNNILQNTNNLRTKIINNLNFNSKNYISQKTGLKNNVNLYFKNINTVAKKDEVYKSSAQSEIMNIVEVNSSYPLKKSSSYKEEFLTPKISLRVNPSDMKNHSASKRTINAENIFSINRLGLGDSIESGKSLTTGVDYRRNNTKTENEIGIKLATVFRDKNESTIPKNTSLNQKNSYLFTSVDYKKSNFLNLNYDFATEDGLNEIIYHDLGLNLTLNNFVTDFNFIQENSDFGKAHIIESNSTYNINDNNLVSFRTRRNEEINLTEYYDLIYQYKYDCLVAGLKFNKTYYQDRDLQPTEELFFSLTLVPLTTWDQQIEKEDINSKW